MAIKTSLRPRTLTGNIHSLPRELFDIIYKKTFASPATTLSIQPDIYSPPTLLQSDRQSRTTFAESYFTNTIFVLPSEDLLTRWLISLDPKHRAMVKDIRCVLWNEDVPEKGSIRAYEHRIEMFNAELRIECMFGKKVAGIVRWEYAEDMGNLTR